jgi:hypothetical protein
MKLDSAVVLNGDSDAAGFADHIPEVFSQSANNEEVL